jgi:hypothetical protein
MKLVTKNVHKSLMLKIVDFFLGFSFFYLLSLVIWQILAK